MTRKKDWAEKQTDKMLDDLESRIKKEYETAYKEVSAKYDRFVKRFEEKDEEKRELVKQGKLSKKEYSEWRTNQLLVGKRWENMKDTLATDLTMVDQKVASMTGEYLPEAYALNFNYSTYDIEMGTRMDTSFTLYNRQTIERLIKNNQTSLLPEMTEEQRLNIPKDKLWNKQHINSAITQAVLQGKPIPEISKSLERVTDMDKRAAVRNARTMMTGAQNAGRLDAYYRAESKGIKIQKEWQANLDDRTRDSHADLDGESVAIREAFSNGLMYPGDPSGEPAEVYNCRCTMDADLVEFRDKDRQRFDKTTGQDIKYMTYRQWEKTRTK